MTPRRVILGAHAERDLRKMPEEEEAVVRRAIRDFAAGNMPNADVVKLEDRLGLRLRVGSWRVLFEFAPGEMTVHRVVRRSERTYR